MSMRDVVVIGGSAGAIAAVRAVLHDLPAGIPATLFLVTHQSSRGPGFLPDVLARAGSCTAQYARDGESFVRGRVYVAPPHRHLVLEAERVRVINGPRHNNHRPSIDVLFRSAALVHGPRTIGVLLSGLLDDGVAGLVAIQQRQGLVVVQHPDEAAFPQLPRNAMEAMRPDHLVPAKSMGPLLTRLVRESAPGGTPPDPSLVLETRHDLGVHVDMDALGTRAAYTCPECDGPLYEIEGRPVRYRCLVGHGFTADHLLAGKGQEIERTMWAAVRSLRERARLETRIAERLETRLPHVAARYRRRAAADSVHAARIEVVLRPRRRSERPAGHESGERS